MDCSLSGSSVHGSPQARILHSSLMSLEFTDTSVTWEAQYINIRQPTPVFLPGRFRGQRNLADYIHGVSKSQPQLNTTESIYVPILPLIHSFIHLLIQKQRHYFANKGPSSQGYSFSSGHVWMWELDCEESWLPKNWCFWTVVLGNTLESPLDCKEIQSVHSKGYQPWVFFGRNDAKAETPVLWPPHAKSWLIGKDSDAGRDWRQDEKGTTEDEMAGWHHWLDECESEWTPGAGYRKGGLACCNSWVCKELDMPDRLNWLNWTMTQQSHCLAYTPRIPELKETRVPQCSSQHCL